MLRLVVGVIGVTSVLSVRAVVQGGGTVSGATPFGNNYHLGFERPEAWGLKYFPSTTLLSGLATPDPIEGHRVGSNRGGIRTRLAARAGRWTTADRV